MNNRKDRLGAAALAKLNYAIPSLTDPRVLPLANALGITFNSSNNVETNNTETRIAALESLVESQAAAIEQLRTDVDKLREDVDELQDEE